jgi:hypothetical protein
VTVAIKPREVSGAKVIENRSIRVTGMPVAE